jgi:hypothetical protein
LLNRLIGELKFSHVYLIAFTWAPYLIKKISKTSFKTHYHEHQANTYSSFD